VNLLGVPVVFLGLKDGTLEQEKADLKRWLEPFASQSWKHVYAPAIQGGHNDHDALGDVVSLMFSPGAITRRTLEERSLRRRKRNRTDAGEVDRKNRALDCYPSANAIASKQTPLRSRARQTRVPGDMPVLGRSSNC